MFLKKFLATRFLSEEKMKLTTTELSLPKIVKMTRRKYKNKVVTVCKLPIYENSFPKPLSHHWHAAA